MIESNIDWKEKAGQYASMCTRNEDQIDSLEAEIERLRTCMIRAKNGIGGTRRFFEEDGNAIGQAMMEGVYLDLEETLAGSVCEADVA